MISSIGSNYATRVNSSQTNKSQNSVSNQSVQTRNSQQAQVNFTGLFGNGNLKGQIAELTADQGKKLEIIEGLSDKVEKLTGENNVLKEFVSNIKEFCQTKKTSPEEILEDLKTYFAGLNNKNSALEKNNQNLASQVTELKTANFHEIQNLKTAHSKELEPFNNLRISPALTDEIIFPEKFVETAVKMKEGLPETKEAILKYLETGDWAQMEKINAHIELFSTLEKGIKQNNYGLPQTKQLFKENNFSEEDMYKLTPYPQHMTYCMTNLIAEALISTPKFANPLYRKNMTENAFPLIKYINDKKTTTWLTDDSLEGCLPREIDRLLKECVKR